MAFKPDQIDTLKTVKTKGNILIEESESPQYSIYEPHELEQILTQEKESNDDKYPKKILSEKSLNNKGEITSDDNILRGHDDNILRNQSKGDRKKINDIEIDKSDLTVK